jgi:hypothetical protein
MRLPVVKGLESVGSIEAVLMRLWKCVGNQDANPCIGKYRGCGTRRGLKAICKKPCVRGGC